MTLSHCFNGKVRVGFWASICSGVAVKALHTSHMVSPSFATYMDSPEVLTGLSSPSWISFIYVI